MCTDPSSITCRTSQHEEEPRGSARAPLGLHRHLSRQKCYYNSITGFIMKRLSIHFIFHFLGAAQAHGTSNPTAGMEPRAAVGRTKIIPESNKRDFRP